jgi:hypothetical protein
MCQWALRYGSLREENDFRVGAYRLPNNAFEPTCEDARAAKRTLAL